MESEQEKEAQIQVVKPNSTQLVFGNEIGQLIKTSGTLVLTEEEEKILSEPFRDDEILLREDGQIYISWVKYSQRLNKAFGLLGWSMVPEGKPKMDGNNLILWGWHLIIRGVYCGFSYGENQYHENNKRMTFGEACEGAKSNALTRLAAKSIGIGGLDLWDKNFINQWLDKYAKWEWETGRDGKNRKVWSLKTTPQKSNNSTPVIQKEITKEDLERIEAKAKECKDHIELQKYFKELTKQEQVDDNVRQIFIKLRK